MRRLSFLLALAVAALPPAHLHAQPADASTVTVQNLRARAAALLDAGRLNDAEPVLRQAVAAGERSLGADHIETIEAANELAGLYFRQGRFAEGEPLLTGLLDRSRRILGPGHRLTLAVAVNLAELYSAQYRDAQALALYEATLAIARASDLNRRDLIVLRTNLANIRRYMGDLETAESDLRALLADARAQLGDGDAATLFVQSNLARVLQEREIAARESQDGAIAGESGPLFIATLEARTRRLGADHPDTLTSIFDLANFHQNEGRDQEADFLYQRALEGRRRILGIAHPDTIQAAEIMTFTRLAIDARTANGCHELVGLSCEDAATRAIDPATIMLEGIAARRRLARGSLFSQAQGRREQPDDSAQLVLYLEAAWQHARSGATTNDALLGDVFAVMQRASSGDASLAVARAAARRVAAARGPRFVEALEEREALTAVWSQLSDRIADSFVAGAGPASPAEIAAEQRRLEQRIAALDASLRADLPELADLLAAEPLPLAEVQRLLGSDEALMLIQPAPFKTHVVTVTRDAAMWDAAPAGTDYVDFAVNDLRLSASGQGRAPDAVVRPDRETAFALDTAFLLYTLLFRNVDALEGKTRLFIAAGGSLARLPFSLLVTEPVIEGDNSSHALRNAPWLADAYALVHVPSVQAFAELRRRPASTGADRGFVGFGDPTLTGAASVRGRGSAAIDAARVIQPTLTRSGGLVADVNALRRLARLPGTLAELNQMRALYGANRSRIFTGEAATEAAVRTAGLENARVLAFATHGLMPSELVEGEETRYASEIYALAEPGLVLTPPAEPSEADDGFLAASEVAALRLDADWVILSACNTAASEADEPGLSLLSRAFFHAGARSLLASHWPVADAVAPRLTVRTIELERGGMGRAEAFQQAMREVRSDRSLDNSPISLAHPFYWAPFVLIGDATAR